MLGFERTLCNRNENYTMKNVCEYGLLVERIHSVVIFLLFWSFEQNEENAEREEKEMY